MKKSVLILTLLAWGLQSFAQEVIYTATLKKEQVPPVVLKAIEVDFPDYIVDAYDAVPEGYDLVNVEEAAKFDSENLSNYQITISSKDQNMVAYYDEDGNLLSTVEYLKNIEPPVEITRSLASTYPGWKLSKTSFHMAKYQHGKTKEQYNLVLTKDGKKKHIHTDMNGHILK